MPVARREPAERARGPAVVLQVDVNLQSRFRREMRLVDLAGDAGRLSVVRTRPVGRAPRAPLVLLHGFAQNGRSFETDRRSLPAYLADAGYDVFAADFRGVGRSRETGSRPATAFHEWVEGDLPAVLEGVRDAGHGGPVFLVGHSLGGAAACAYAGRHPARVRGVATLAGVWDFGRSNAWIRLACHALHAAHGSAAAPYLPGHVPTDLAGRLLHRFRRGMDHRLARWLPLQAWAPGSIEPAVLDEAIRRSFEPVTLGMAACLAAAGTGRGLVDPRGRPYAQDFEAVPGLSLLVLAGGADPLVSTRDSRAAFDRSFSRDKTFRRFGSGGTPAFGHVDLILGRHAPRHVWPALREWLDCH